jgi:RHS repeat-associated protein
VSDYTFTGQRADSYIKLVEMGARWYDPKLGRFVSADTVVPEPGNPQALNRYSYTYNNPVRYTDPSGHGVPLKCWVCGLKIDISGWSDSAKNLAVAASHVTDFNVDLEQGLITGPTEQEYLDNSVNNLCPTPIGMVEGPAVKIGEQLVQEGIEQVGKGATREATEQGLNIFARAAEFGVKPYDELKKLTKGLGLRVHHLIEKRFAGNLGLESGEIPSVALTAEEHQRFTNAWRKAIGYSRDKAPIKTVDAYLEEVWTTAQHVYADYPELLNEVKQHLGIAE